MTTDTKPPAKIGVFTFVMITAAVVVSVRTLPMTAQPGMTTLFLTLASALLFLVPTALVSAELATAWPQDGGIFIWVREAFGERIGFVAVWMQWIQMVFGMTSIIMVIAATFAYVFDPALASNKFYMLAMILGIWWGCTLVNMRGVKTLGWVSTVCVSLGVFLPGVLLIGCGITYVLAGHPIMTDVSWTWSNLIPSFSDSGTMGLFIGFVFVVMGMEVSASNVSSIKDARRNYPIAIILVSIVMVLLSVIGSAAIFVAIPKQQISMTAGLMQAFDLYFRQWGMPWLAPVMALCVGLGLVGQVNSWVLGPVRGLQATANSGALPAFLQKSNAHGVPVTLVLIQAFAITLVGVLITVMPNVDNFYFMLMGLTGLVYLVAYLFMFAAAIHLRYKRPDVARSFKVPGGNLGMWICAGLGLAVSLLAGYLGFVPPGTFQGARSQYVEFQLIGLLVMLVIPFLVYAYGQKSRRSRLAAPAVRPDVAPARVVVPTRHRK
ncbi:APC family permease [Burkholderia plantarii]|uniref:Glutamate/gamma-aminobutyrate antiporter n=1 Tax=Burkholderia plantarii TaxID=41899 RepID=A0A0B6RTN0_BURPL|nr:APC family permease [Burkholderia plantarii]AJK48702.1 glutamate/gamma-aminobutyrate antiporter [Burkholderia plantarii]ALK32934.1 amino acid permease [Burkholderia plantarii]GLZ20363.1 transporter [Burkholderia plantarii]